MIDKFPFFLKMVKSRQWDVDLQQSWLIRAQREKNVNVSTFNESPESAPSDSLSENYLMLWILQQALKK